MMAMKSTFISRTLNEQEQTHLSNNLSQARVAHDQPAPGCDAVGLVLKLLRVHLIEILEPGVGEEPQSETYYGDYVQSISTGKPYNIKI